MRQAGGAALCFSGDIAEPGIAASVVVAAHEAGWHIKHLVCNAGIGKNGPTDSFDPHLWRTIFAVNVHSTFDFVRASLPNLMDDGGGVITLMSSTAGIEGVAYDAAYTASKHALVGFAQFADVGISQTGDYDSRALSKFH
ncbi:MAG: SDR family oxidoreductase [Pirellulales bacterium]